MELNKLHNIDCRDFCDEYVRKFMENPLEYEGVADLLVTSPPYNVKREYDGYQDNLQYEEYLNFLIKCFGRFYYFMKQDSVICVNVGRDYGYNIPADLATILKQQSYNFYVNIIWKKPVASAQQVALLKPGFPKYQPYLVTENVLIYTKGNMPRLEPTDEDMKLRREFRSNVWEIRPDYNPNHPAVMPKKLAYLLIKFFSKECDVVWDPFAGTSTTLITAREQKRQFVGCEISPRYYKLSNNSLSQELLL